MSDDSEQNTASVWEKLRPWIIGVAAALALGALYYFLATRGPRQVNTSMAAVSAVDDEALEKLSTEVAQAESVWRAADEIGQGNSAEAQAALAKAVEKQRERVRRDARSTQAESERLRGLEQLMADGEVRKDLSAVSVLENEATKARGAGRGPESIEKLKRALALLQGINRSNAAAALKDMPRESRLKLDLETWEAEPLSRQVANARAKAESAARAERWDEVQEAFQDLLAVQLRINREYPRTPFVDTAAEDRVEGQIQSLRASTLGDTVLDKVSGGEENARAGQHAEAARLFALALAAQETINTKFPKSRQYSPSTLDDLESRRQTALSMDGLAKTRALDGEAMQCLRAGDLALAQKKIAEAAQWATATWRDFPRSLSLDEALRERVSYLAGKSGSLGVIHAAVFPELRPLPRADGSGANAQMAAKLLARETPQALYTLVLDKNPSRVPGEQKAVDSVSWIEAQDFCRRLGWILGRVVRLPSEVQYRAALGAAGFSELTGGVAEWLDAAGSDGTAVIAGGSYLESAAALAAVPMTRISKTERARHVGFRFLVE